MKVLVTGGAGLVGSSMCSRLLNEGHEVFCIDNLSLGTLRHLKDFENNALFTFEKWDVSEKEWFKKLEGKNFDLLIHLAANSDISIGHQNPSYEFNKTLETTFQCLLAAKYLKIPHFIFSSTSAVYGSNPEFPTPESAKDLLPVSLYGSAKLASEAFISSFVENYGLSAWIFRFGNVVGQKLTHGVIYDFTKKLLEHPSELSVLGNGTQTKTYIDVEDCVSGIFHAYQKSPAGIGHKEKLQIFNLSTEGTTSVRYIAEKCVEILTQSKAQIKYGSSSIGWIGDVPKTQLDTSRMLKLGWKPSKDSNQTVLSAVKAHYDWIKSNS